MMKKIVDYIFYRTYLAYEKKGMSGTFSSILYISLGCFFLFIFIPGLLYDLLVGCSEAVTNGLFFCYLAIILSFMFNWYFKEEEVKKIFTNYKDSATNKLIPTWIFFILLPLCMVIGISLYAFLHKFFINKYNLHGYLYNHH